MVAEPKAPAPPLPRPHSSSDMKRSSTLTSTTSAGRVRASAYPAHQAARFDKKQQFARRILAPIRRPRHSRCRYIRLVGRRCQPAMPKDRWMPNSTPK